MDYKRTETRLRSLNGQRKCHFVIACHDADASESAMLCHVESRNILMFGVLAGFKDLPLLLNTHWATHTQNARE